ncbi:MAG: prepilin-type N-terminal cleavage/methylation domain-containing protein [Kofleriaceae bacterium]|nr:prepilin-type N-terminal cleavage/methylation domain-containing protein [Kofleriaceae bacterium]
MSKRSKVTTRNSQRGFTLMEIMITVGIIAVLAAIAVPVFSRETKKAKGSSEVAGMFGELGIRQDQYKLENGAYLSAAACPATSVAAGQDASGCIAAGQPWASMRVRLPTTRLMCSYQMEAGTGTTGASAPSGFAFSPPAGAWYFIVATCNMDGDNSVNATYFISSVDSKMQSQNEGR